MEQIQLIPVSDRFALCGALQRVCSYLSHNELKQVRLASRLWNYVVTGQKIFQKSVCKLTHSFMDQLGQHVNERSCHKWYGAYFQSMSFIDKQLFKFYWSLQKNALRVLKFSSIYAPCDRVLTFINEHPNLEEIFFNNCNFKTVPFDPKPNDPHQMRNIRYIMCLHRNGLADLTEGNPQLPRPTIRSITLKRQITFPLCIMEALCLRSQGCLESLVIKECHVFFETRLQYVPQEAAMANLVTRLIQGSNQSLKRVCFENIPSLGVYIQNMAQLPDAVEFPQMREFSMRETGQIAAFNVDLHTHVTALLQRLPVEMEKIKLNFIMRWFEMNATFAVLATFVQLKSFSFHMHGRRISRNHVQNLIRAAPLLEEFDLQCHEEANGLDFSGNLRLLCPNISSLDIMFGRISITEILQMRTLRCLHIHNARQMSNNDLRTIFYRLRQLEELSLRGAHTLVTDSGFCGFSANTLQGIREAEDKETRDNLGVAANARVAELGTPRLATLKRLKKLRLYACMPTDITTSYGITCQHLRELDLTSCSNISDYSMEALGLNNPGLERVILIQTKWVTRTGINDLIRARPTLVDVHTTKLICSKWRQGFENQEDHPKFKRIVSIAKKNESKAPPLHEM